MDHAKAPIVNKTSLFEIVEPRKEVLLQRFASGPPPWDGLAVAQVQLFLATIDGSVCRASIGVSLRFWFHYREFDELGVLAFPQPALVGGRFDFIGHFATQVAQCRLGELGSGPTIVAGIAGGRLDAGLRTKKDFPAYSV